MILSPVVAHTGHNHSTIEPNQSDTGQQQDQEQTRIGFKQLYPESRSGTVWVLAEVVLVLGATGLAVRHYFRKSECGSLKEFIRERIL